MDPREGRTSQGRLYLQRVDIGGRVVVGGGVIYQIALRKGEPTLLSETGSGLHFLGPGM